MTYNVFGGTLNPAQFKSRGSLTGYSISWFGFVWCKSFRLCERVHLISESPKPAWIHFHSWCDAFTAKRPFHLPSECETGFTVYLNADSIIKYSPLATCLLSSVLRRCWLGGRKSIWPVRNWVIGAGIWKELQIICTWSSWCHCHPVISCFVGIQNG